MNTLVTFQCSPSTSGGGRYFRLGGLNDECVCNHVGSRGIWEHFPLENFSQFKALRSLLRSVLSQNSSTACDLICCAVFATKHGHHVDVTCQPSVLPWSLRQGRASELAAAFRTTIKSVQSLFNWCLTCNQMGIFSYPARMKRAGLSSLDRNFRGL